MRRARRRGVRARASTASNSYSRSKNRNRQPAQARCTAAGGVVPPRLASTRNKQLKLRRARRRVRSHSDLPHATQKTHSPYRAHRRSTRGHRAAYTGPRLATLLFFKAAQQLPSASSLDTRPSRRSHGSSARHPPALQGSPTTTGRIVTRHTAIAPLTRVLGSPPSCSPRQPNNYRAHRRSTCGHRAAQAHKHPLPVSHYALAILVKQLGRASSAHGQRGP